MEGACEASLACVTCHCYVEDEAMFDMVREAGLGTWKGRFQRIIDSSEGDT